MGCLQPEVMLSVIKVQTSELCSQESQVWVGVLDFEVSSFAWVGCLHTLKGARVECWKSPQQASEEKRFQHTHTPSLCYKYQHGKADTTHTDRLTSMWKKKNSNVIKQNAYETKVILCQFICIWNREVSGSIDLIYFSKGTLTYRR